jgi:hypothetical protein
MKGMESNNTKTVYLSIVDGFCVVGKCLNVCITPEVAANRQVMEVRMQRMLRCIAKAVYIIVYTAFGHL